jgi:hypothetical protein
MTEENHGTLQSGKSVVGSIDLNRPATNTSWKGYSVNGPRKRTAFRLKSRTHRPDGQMKERDGRDV